MEMSNSDGSLHKEMEKVLGIPISLVYLEDHLFEGLENKEAKMFPLRFLDAIKVGSDLSLISPKFVFWMLTDKEGIIKNAFPDGKKAIKKTAKLYKKLISGKTVTTEEWSAARAAAESAWSAAESDSATDSATDSDSATWAASGAVWSARSDARAAAKLANNAGSSAWSSAWSSAEEEAAEEIKFEAYKKMADRLIELLEEEKLLIK